jgi:hypothetical protein
VLTQEELNPLMDSSKQYKATPGLWDVSQNLFSQGLDYPARIIYPEHIPAFIPALIHPVIFNCATT